MRINKTFDNRVCVKLDADNDFIIMPKSGIKLFVDNTYEPEKHVVRTGEVIAVPDNLYYKRESKTYYSSQEIKEGKVNKKQGMPWKTEMEIQVGDRVVMYFIAVQNCLRPEFKNYIREGNTIWIFIQYQNIYAVIREGKIIPVNGYVLVEPDEDPEWLRKVEKYKKLGVTLPDLRKVSSRKVVHGKVAYVGKKNLEYMDEGYSDEFVDVKEGDEVIMRRISDIPVEYEYHAKLDGGRKLYRVQRHDILSIKN